VWRFDVPGFDVRFLALDLSHTQDQGTTWQTNHPFTEGSEQFAWYARESARRDRGIVITLQTNAARRCAGMKKVHGAGCSSRQRGHHGLRLLRRARGVDGFPYFNTALGAGAKYPDPQSKFFASEPGYVLLRIPRGGATFSVELKTSPAPCSTAASGRRGRSEEWRVASRCAPFSPRRSRGGCRGEINHRWPRL